VSDRRRRRRWGLLPGIFLTLDLNLFFRRRSLASEERATTKKGAIQVKKLTALIVTLFFATVLPLAQAGSASTKALNPQPLPPGKAVNPRVQVNPQPLPPGANAQSGALIEGFANVTDRNIDRINAIGTHTNESAASRISVSRPARPATTK
jgi:hypothetical protein